MEILSIVTIKKAKWASLLPLVAMEICYLMPDIFIPTEVFRTGRKIKHTTHIITLNKWNIPEQMVRHIALHHYIIKRPL